MLKLILPKHILSWLYAVKGEFSLPVAIIHCLGYIRDNNITMEHIIKERLHQERGEQNETTKGNDKGRKD